MLVLKSVLKEAVKSGTVDYVEEKTRFHVFPRGIPRF